MNDQQSANHCYCSPKFDEKNRKKGDYKDYKRRYVYPACTEDLKEYGGKFYCLMHAPDEGKTKLFESFIKKKIQNQDYNFRGYWFPSDTENVFENVVFSKNTSFVGGRFNGKIIFSHSQFDGYVSFRDADFENEARFRDVIFNKKAVFTTAAFKSGVIFNKSRFSDKAYFYETDFQGSIDFSDVQCANYVIFRGKTEKEKSGKEIIRPVWKLDIEDSEFEKPDQIIFQDISLKPATFLSLEPKKFIFINMDWGNISHTKEYTRNELRAIQNSESIDQRTNLLNPYPLFARTCRQLAYNAEENSRFEEASNFRKIAFETERLERKENRKAWSNKFTEVFSSDIYFSDFFSGSKTPIKKFWNIIKDFPSDILHSIYGFSSSYGESWRRAFLVLVGIWFVFSLIYTQVDFSVCPADKSNVPQNKVCERSLCLDEAMKHSFGTMFLQKSESRKPLERAEIFVLIETVLAPLQAAILALAIRRKFMR